VIVVFSICCVGWKPVWRWRLSDESHQRAVWGFVSRSCWSHW